MAEIGARARRNTIGDAVRRAGARFRDRPALRFGDRLWSFAELDLAADRVARMLLDSGLAQGDRVVAFGKNSDGFLLLWLGCARAGLVHVPANFALTARGARLHPAAMRRCGVFVQPALRPVADRARGHLLRGTLDAGEGRHDILAAAHGPALGPARRPGGGRGRREEDLVQLQYTSGTTGQPKGAMMTHRAILAEYASVTVELEMRARRPGARRPAAVPHRADALLHHAAAAERRLTILLEAPTRPWCWN